VYDFDIFQPLFKGGKNFPSISIKESQSAETNNLMIVGQSNQHLHQNYLHSQQNKTFSSPSPDFSVSTSSSSPSNNSNIQQQPKDISARPDVITPNANDTSYQGISSSLQTKAIRPPTRRARSWKSQQNISVSGVGNPYPTNNQYINQPLPNHFPVCQQSMHQNHLVLSNPLVAASCCLHQHQDPFGNIYFVPQKPALDLGLCRGCRRLYASSPMIQNPSLAGVSKKLMYYFSSIIHTTSPTSNNPNWSDCYCRTKTNKEKSVL
jgi:hypothetical protein